MPESDVTKMKVADLKRELKLRGLPVNGNKNELSDRLQTALLEGSLSLEDSAIENLDGDDVLLTDEDEHKLLEDDDDELLKSPVSTPTATSVPDLLKPATEEADKTETETSTAATLPAKKIVLKLKRNNSQLGIATTSKENAAPEAGEGAKQEEPPKHKPIVIGGGTAAVDSSDNNQKLGQLSLQERLERRAKKFGISAAPAAASAGLAAAINKSSSASIVANKGNKETDEQQKEALKRRAERFGSVVPEKTTKTMAEERLQKRKERFGGGSGATAATEAKTVSSGADWSEKARARLERFKTTNTAAATTK